jgi:hypothetical protein
MKWRPFTDIMFMTEKIVNKMKPLFTNSYISFNRQSLQPSTYTDTKSKVKRMPAVYDKSKSKHVNTNQQIFKSAADLNKCTCKKRNFKEGYFRRLCNSSEQRQISIFLRSVIVIQIINIQRYIYLSKFRNTCFIIFKCQPKWRRFGPFLKDTNKVEHNNS